MKYKIILYCLIVMFNTRIISAQNLISNPSFEQFDTCPTWYGQINKAIPWSNPSTSSPDYFNSCNGAILNVPMNSLGYQSARTGVAYADIVIDVFNTINPFQNDYREYIQSPLVPPLEEGIKYCVKFYVSAVDSTQYTSNDIGVYFSQIEIHDTCQAGLSCPLNYNPQFENAFNNNLNSYSDWIEISGEYVSSGGEKFIVIGNFKDHNSTLSTYTGWASGSNYYQAAFYIDDVSVYKCNSGSYSNLVNMPNIFTPNDDGLNDSFIPLEENDILLGQLRIFNRWGLKIFSSDNIFNGWDGSNSPDGVYYWELEFLDKSLISHNNVGYIVLIR